MTSRTAPEPRSSTEVGADEFDLVDTLASGLEHRNRAWDFIHRFVAA